MFASCEHDRFDCVEYDIFADAKVIVTDQIIDAMVFLLGSRTWKGGEISRCGHFVSLVEMTIWRMQSVETNVTEGQTNCHHSKGT